MIMEIDTTPLSAACYADDNDPMLPVDQARQRIASRLTPITGFECVPIVQAAGRILQQPIQSPFDVPSHTNSAVDGYAFNSEDAPAGGECIELILEGRSLAGQPSVSRLNRGSACRITTGAALPNGADTVVMQEDVERTDQTIKLSNMLRRGANIRRCGEDMKQGEQILQAGRFITPADIGLLASLGICEIAVRRRLRVTLFSTGDELFDPGEQRTLSGLYDSNRYTLTAALQRVGVEVRDLGIIPDDKKVLQQALSDAAGSDLIISSGGVSVGDADYTQSVLSELGQLEFWRVAIKPGRPLLFGLIGGQPFFGLPGNPVAVMVTFYQFVLPALEQLIGLNDKPLAPTLLATAVESIRKRPGRTEVQRAIVEQSAPGHFQVRTTGKQGSGILRSMSLANAFIILPHQRDQVEAGETVTVQPFAGLI